MKLSITNYFYIIVGLPWLFLMLFTSGSYTEVKAILMGMLLVMSILEVIICRIPINVTHLKFVTIFGAYFLLSLLIGIINGFPFDFFKDFGLCYYYIITPICILFFSTIFTKRPGRRTFLWRSIIVLTFLLVTLDLAKVSLFAIGISPSFLEFIKMNSEDLTTSLHLRVNNESSLMFLLPIFVYLVINPNTSNKYLRLSYLIIFVLGTAYAILSGRKMLEILIVLTFIASIVYKIRKNNSFNGGKLLRGLLIFLLFFVVLFKYASNFVSDILGIEDVFTLAYDSFTGGLASNSDGVEKRVGNTQSLLDMFYNSPIWGYGVNSYAENSLANDESKWSYEVVYVAWLAQTGFIGALLLLTPVIYLIKKLINRGRLLLDNKYYGIVVGFICFIICGASNPLVYFVWPWTITLIYANEPIKVNMVNR